MKLYFMPGACSLAVHVALVLTDRPFEIESVDYATRRTSGDQDFWEINPKGYVPALELEDGRIFTEIPVILHYLDSIEPQTNLLPASFEERLQALEWLHFLATEVHKSFSPLFRRETPVSFLNAGRLHLRKRLTMVEKTLRPSCFLLGAEFSVVDAYLYTLCRWLPEQDIDIGQWPMLSENFQRVDAMGAVKKALANEAWSTANNAQIGGIRRALPTCLRRQDSGLICVDQAVISRA